VIFQTITALRSHTAPSEISIPLIAKLGGVQPSTLYRRWGSVTALLAAATLQEEQWGISTTVSGDLVSDLRNLILGYARLLSSQDGRMVLLTDVQASSEPNGSPQHLESMRAQLGNILGEVEVGDHQDLANEIIDAVISPLIIRALFYPREDLEQRAEGLMEGWVIGSGIDR
jgi:AcrR family transcriptional regulator